MEKHIDYKTHGTCSSMVRLTVEDGIIKDCEFIGGCNGNTQGICALVRGMKAEDAVARLRGIKCGHKSTSCPDQLALALEELSQQKKK